MKVSSMDGINSPIPVLAVAESAFSAWVAALAATLMLLFLPAVSADELICEVLRDGSPVRYLISIDDQRGTVAVVDADTNKPTPVTIGELRPERMLFAFNGMRMDPTKFVRHGKVVMMSLTTHADGLLDRSTNSFTEIGYVTDDKGQIVSLEDLKELQAEEEAWMARQKDGTGHHPMFWLFLEATTYRYDGLCRTAPPHPGK